MIWMRKSNGSITVYVTLVLIVVLSLLAAGLENARVSVASLDMERCFSGSLDATLTEYYKPLFDDYGLLFMDQGVASDSLEYERLTKQIEDYMNTNLSTTTSRSLFGYTFSGTGMDVFAPQITSVQVDSAIRATDHKGKIVQEEAVQLMKYGVTADALQEVLKHFELIEDSKATATVMEKESEVDEKFEKSNKLVIELMEIVEGITYKNGLKYEPNGLLQIKASFAKKICVGAVTKKKVGIENDTVFQSTKNQYYDPVKPLEDIKKSLKEMLEEKEKEEKAKEEEAKKEEETKRNPTPKEEPKETEAEEQEEEPSYEYGKCIKEVNKKRQEIVEVTQKTLSKIGEAKRVIGKLEKQVPSLEKAVKEYDATVEEQKDQVSREEYDTLSNTRAQLGKDLAAVKVAASMKGRLEQNEKLLKALQKDMNGILRESTEDMEKLKDACDKQLKEMKGYSISELTFRYGKIKKEITSNPLDVLGGLSEGVLALVVKDVNKLSKKKLENVDYYNTQFGTKAESSPDVDTGHFAELGDTGGIFSSVCDTFGGAKDISSMGTAACETLLFQAYIKDYFKSYISTDSRFAETPLEYEQEYILCGKASDKGNLAQLVNRILLLRTVVNFAYLLTDSVGMEKAHVTAELLVGFTGLEPLVRVMQFAILAAWAYEESLVDVAALLQGGRIPLVKTKATFMLSYSNIFAINHSLIQSKAESLAKKATVPAMSYEDYLNMFLLFEKQTQKTYRTMDVIEANMRLRHSELFAFEDCMYGYTASCSYSIPAKFAAMSFMSDWDYKDRCWDLSISQTYTY